MGKQEQQCFQYDHRADVFGNEPLDVFGKGLLVHVLLPKRSVGEMITPRKWENTRFSAPRHRPRRMRKSASACSSKWSTTGTESGSAKSIHLYRIS
jgi:hypothetical protein